MLEYMLHLVVVRTMPASLEQHPFLECHDCVLHLQQQASAAAARELLCDCEVLHCKLIPEESMSSSRSKDLIAAASGCSSAVSPGTVIGVDVKVGRTAGAEGVAQLKNVGTSANTEVPPSTGQAEGAEDVAQLFDGATSASKRLSRK
ncbi:hypothetical protein FOCC_FOCC017086 [Frankliniella occidentalis]|nr:hypothetical protein FOCC_FOCC017086 [Frankliniella occidentalis]